MDSKLSTAAARESETSNSGTARIETWIRAFSDALALRGDLVTPDECVSLLPKDWIDDVRSASWNALDSRLARQLVEEMDREQTRAEVAESLCRLLLIIDLVAVLAAGRRRPKADISDRRWWVVWFRRLREWWLDLFRDETSQDVKPVITSAAEVRARVSWRHVIIPAQHVDQAEHGVSLLARRPGVTDLYVVRDEWNHYEAGELAAVVNVLPGETFSQSVRHATEVDTLTSTTTETTSSQLTEMQQTASSNLAEASTKDSSVNIGVQGQVQTSGQYGPTQVNTSLGAQLQISQAQSDSRALTTANQTVQRSVKSVTERVSTIRSERTVTRDSTRSLHKLQNSGSKATVGTYRWLTSVHYVEVVRYPNRFVLEFQIPEPGAWLRWALRNPPTGDWDNPHPGQFRLPTAAKDLSPDQITADNWMTLAGLWRVRGLSAPPAASLTIGTQLSVDTTEKYAADDVKTPTVPRIAMAADDSVTVPNGYQAVTWSAAITSFKGHGPWNFEEAWITVGASQTSQQTVWAQATPNPDISGPRLVGRPAISDDVKIFNVGDITTGTIPISVYAFEFLDGFTCNVDIECTLLPEALTQWQQDTFDQVAAAYQSRLDAHRRERDERNQLAGRPFDTAGPPELNKHRAVDELRRMVIQDLRGVLMGGTTDVKSDGKSPFDGADEPYVPAKPLEDTETIQFFEQLFEWENLVYICYPYYWARHEKWVENATSASSDPVLDGFLNAGSSRVVVPARPGFENVVLYYLYTGKIWGGTQPPAPDEPGYLSMAQEIESVQRGATDGTPLSPSWSVRLPTTLLWAGTDESTLPRRLAPTIPEPPHR
ncbi:hypothetical protein ODJ79_16055 [Actinoplanes sp. KI2]|uniref:hypothetical protein n=1 Tax=Actinoplanes sp. KI2 TaxID=2983315 RepID=UPI0021D60B8B|nr:hypothetical protein [Actinoplanes sp. KI2]MCU7725243.1 hypothetical protein [Actinoplanes sp. KI2]